MVFVSRSKSAISDPGPNNGPRRWQDHEDCAHHRHAGAFVPQDPPPCSGGGFRLLALLRGLGSCPAHPTNCYGTVKIVRQGQRWAVKYRYQTAKRHNQPAMRTKRRGPGIGKYCSVPLEPRRTTPRSCRLAGHSGNPALRRPCRSRSRSANRLKGSLAKNCTTEKSGTKRRTSAT
jgi:hypothetical protein